MFYVFLMSKNGTEQEEQIRAFAEGVQRKDEHAQIKFNPGEVYSGCWIVSKELGGYVSNGPTGIKLRVHIIGELSNYIEIPFDCVNTLYNI